MWIYLILPYTVTSKLQPHKNHTTQTLFDNCFTRPTLCTSPHFIQWNRVPWGCKWPYYKSYSCLSQFGQWYLKYNFSIYSLHVLNIHYMSGSILGTEDIKHFFFFRRPSSHLIEFLTLIEFLHESSVDRELLHKPCSSSMAIEEKHFFEFNSSSALEGINHF